MTDDLETRIARTLTETAEADPYPELLPAVADRGRRLRRRRRAALGATTTAVAAVVALAVVTLPNLGHQPNQHGTVRAGHGGTPTAGASPTRAPSGRVLAPPTAPGKPTAESDPSVVGSNPMLVHLGLSWVPGDTKGMTWGGQAGTETVTVQQASGDDGAVGATLAGSSKQLFTVIGKPELVDTTTVGGKPAKLYAGHSRSYLVWQPLPGVWAAAYAGDQHTAASLAAGARFDKVYQCSSPATVRQVPSGTALAKCELTVSTENADVQYASTLYLWNADRSRVAVVGFSDMKSQMPVDEADGTVTVQGHQGLLMRKQEGVVTLRLSEFAGFGMVDVTGQGLSDDELVAVANGLHVTGRPDRPTTWVTDPVPGR